MNRNLPDMLLIRIATKWYSCWFTKAKCSIRAIINVTIHKSPINSPNEDPDQSSGARCVACCGLWLLCILLSLWLIFIEYKKCIKDDYKSAFWVFVIFPNQLLDIYLVLKLLFFKKYDIKKKIWMKLKNQSLIDFQALNDKLYSTLLNNTNWSPSMFILRRIVTKHQIFRILANITPHAVQNMASYDWILYNKRK